MPTCFVIQPFDGGKYDKRFDDVYSPAITEAGLEPYRTDKDPRVEVPIDAVEDGIKNSSVCLADITTDNPNVWYELGYAFALGKPVVMVCSAERVGNKYPFDIQHRTITSYKVESPRDFTALQNAITKRILALLSKGDALKSIQEKQQLAPVAGLSQPELAVLAATAGSVDVPGAVISTHSVRNDVEQSGFTKLAFTLGMRRLLEKGFIHNSRQEDYNGYEYDVIAISPEGWNWIEANEQLFSLQKDPSNKPKTRLSPRSAPTSTDEGDDIPF